jgi:enoyl-CoA hydratase
MDRFFRLAADAGIAHLVLDRPERLNTMTPAFFAQLREAVRGLQAEGGTRVLVISSTGKHFSAGMALEALAGDEVVGVATPRQRLAFHDLLRDLIDCFDVLDRARFPVIAAVHGGCIGGALDLVTACDIRLCSADAFFTLQEIQIGMMADVGVIQRLSKIVPQGVVREMAYTGEKLGAERALAIGLVNAVLPDADALRAHAMALAGSIAAKSPLAIAGSKMALNDARDHGVREALERMALLQSAIIDPDDLGRAIAAWKARAAAAFEPLRPAADVTKTR